MANTAEEINVEKMLLHCLISDFNVLEYPGLSEDMFIDSRNKDIYRAIKETAETSVMTSGAVIETLKKNGKYDSRYYESIINMSVPQHAGKAIYELVAKNHKRRALAQAGKEICTSAVNGDIDAALTNAYEKLSMFLDSGHSQNTFSLGEISEVVLGNLQNNANHRIKTGYKIDEITGGFAPGELNILAARPGMGKTALAATLGTGAAKLGYPTMIYSMEMTAEQIGRRILSASSMIPHAKIVSGSLTSEEKETLEKAAQQNSSLPFYIVEAEEASLAEFSTTAQRYVSSYGAKLIIIDYLQLFDETTAYSNAQEAISHISRSLKKIAKRYKVPIIALSQLNRQLEARLDKRPTLADLRGSGSLEQDADVVMLLYRDGYYHPEKENDGETEISIAKNRNGSTGMVKMSFDRQFTAFYDYFS